MMKPSLGTRPKLRLPRRGHLGFRICRTLLPFAVLGFCSLAPAVASGVQEAPGQEADQLEKGSQNVRLLTLEEMVELSRQASPKLWSQRHIIDQAEAQLRQARAGRLPRLEYVQVASLVPEARGNPVYSPDDRSELLSNLGPFTRIEITVNQPLYTFGKLKAHIEAADQGLEAKQASLERFEQELVQSVKELYYTAQLNEELRRLVSDTVEQFEKAVQKAEELLEKGEGTLTQQDLLKLRYGLSRARGELLEIEKGQALVHSALLRLLCLPPGEDFDLKEKRLKPAPVELQDLCSYQQKASQRPEWRQLAAGIEAKKAELRAEQKTWLPDLFLTGLFRYAVAPNRDEQDNPFAVEEFNYLEGGVLLGWRLALDFGIPARIAAKQAEVSQLLQEQRDATSGMLLEVEKAWREAEQKQKALSYAAEARKNGRALAATAASSFHLGLGEAKDVFEAFGIYTEAAAQYYLAIKDFNLAVAELERVTGQKLQGPSD